MFSTPKLFIGKFNYLLAYNLSMKPPMTTKPMPASSPNLPINHIGKLFGIVYITLTGVIDTIIPATGLWSWVGKSVSYLFKLAPLLWWALPTKNLAQVTPGNNRPAAQDWIPDIMPSTSAQTAGPRVIVHSPLVPYEAASPKVLVCSLPAPYESSNLSYYAGASGLGVSSSQSNAIGETVRLDALLWPEATCSPQDLLLQADLPIERAPLFPEIQRGVHSAGFSPFWALSSPDILAEFLFFAMQHQPQVDVFKHFLLVECGSLERDLMMLRSSFAAAVQELTHPQLPAGYDLSVELDCILLFSGVVSNAGIYLCCQLLVIPRS
ncbi:hypothetical protein DSO57_1017445 [Entomophthora muscae]|uniref:Uncharacterized protein n=1 Tax=Entomophthora muscae TaxID=34485 RepID=A0ACC2RJ77_9FUNG|nr:hypothetical protein DSO57_1017445 [Entomophthora muscae]